MKEFAKSAIAYAITVTVPTFAVGAVSAIAYKIGFDEGRIDAANMISKSIDRISKEVEEDKKTQ